MMAVEFYTKDECPQCAMTSRAFDKYGIAPSDVFSLDDEATLNKMIEAGYQSAPIVRVVDDASGEVLKEWTGFRPDSIKELGQVAAEIRRDYSPDPGADYTIASDQGVVIAQVAHKELDRSGAGVN